MDFLPSSRRKQEACCEGCCVFPSPNTVLHPFELFSFFSINRMGWENRRYPASVYCVYDEKNQRTSSSSLPSVKSGSLIANFNFAHGFLSRGERIKRKSFFILQETRERDDNEESYFLDQAHFRFWKWLNWDEGRERRWDCENRVYFEDSDREECVIWSGGV